MKRYFTLLVFSLILLVGSIMLTETLHSWKTARFKPNPGAVAQRLDDTLIPADPLQIEYAANAFFALNRPDDGTKLRRYIAYAVISRELALPVKTAHTVGKAVKWVSDSPAEVNAVFLKAVQTPSAAGLVPFMPSMFKYKEIFQLQVTGSGVIESNFLLDEQHSAKGRSLVEASSCQDRGDCEQRLKKELAVFGAFTEMLIFIITGGLPGVVLAGVIHKLPFSRKLMFSLLGLCSLLAFPVAYLNGGDGYGPLAAVFLLLFVIGGLWIGLALGSWALPPRKSS